MGETPQEHSFRVEAAKQNATNINNLVKKKKPQPQQLSEEELEKRRPKVDRSKVGHLCSLPDYGQNHGKEEANGDGAKAKENGEREGESAGNAGKGKGKRKAVEFAEVVEEVGTGKKTKLEDEST